ncbi:MAG: hypothetical protein QM654_15520 [Dysgonamonadaceae bacterium]
MTIIKRASAAIILCLLTAACIHAQNTYSPNSSLGLGEIANNDYSQTAGMAGVGIGMRNGTSLNTSNPAAIAAIDSVTGIFEASVFGKYSSFNNSSSNSAFAGNFKKLAIGFRGTKWWSMSIGLKPYSNVGYNVQSESPVEGGTSKTIYFEGSGGLYTLYATNAIQLGSHFSFGVTSYLIAGSFTNTENQNSYRFTTESRLTQFHNKFGLQYQKENWVFGVVYGYKQKTGVKNEFTVYNSSSVAESSEKLKNTNQFIPASYGVGASYKKNKFVVAADYEWVKWKGLQSGVSNVAIGDSHTAKIGLSYTPYRDIYTKHLAKQYQLGLSVNKSYIEVKNSTAWNYSVSTGMSIPMRASQTQRALLNVGLEFGSNMKAPSGYITENYVLLSINFSLIETMFMRSKIF